MHLEGKYMLLHVTYTVYPIYERSQPEQNGVMPALKLHSLLMTYIHPTHTDHAVYVKPTSRFSAGPDVITASARFE